MATNIFESLTDRLPPDVLARAASSLGESPEAIGKATRGSLATVLSGLVRGSGNSELMSQVYGLIKSPANDTSVIQNPANLLESLSGRRTAAGDLGGSLLGSLFGERLSGISDAIASYAGVRSGSAASLLGMVAPLVLGFLGDRVKRDGLDATGFTRLLASQKDAVASAIPAPLARALGVAEPVREASWQPPRAEPARVVQERRGINWLWPLLAAAAIAGIWLITRGRRPVEPAVTVVDSAITPGAPGVGVGAGLGAPANWVKVTLPGGVELNLPPDGIEARVVAFIEDSTAAVNDTTWFDFDRLLFETGSATLRPESQEQLRNVAEILKAYPGVNVKIGGYTDSTGNPADNLKLSDDRAQNVKQELVTLGVQPARIDAEGYGEQHPVGDNTTEEGRAQNRRIALRVTKK
jgi:OOP family OmpA-OmpF porin